MPDKWCLNYLEGYSVAFVKKGGDPSDRPSANGAVLDSKLKSVTISLLG